MPDFNAFTAWMLAHPRSNDWLEVIGVVGDTPNRGLGEPPRPAVYVPYSLVLGDSFNLAIRTRGNPLYYAHAARQRIHMVNASQPVNDIRTAEQILVEEGWAAERFVAALFLLFSSLGLALAAVGVYSVVAFTTKMRRQEFGIRMALGAQRLMIARLVLLSGARSVVAGLIAGVALCWVANAVLQRWIKSSLHDPMLLSTVAVVLTLVVLGASCLPAWRGASVDPLRALRENSE
jgi:ABC-type antimicrobial peptide transport system permease subunit